MSLIQQVSTETVDEQDRFDFWRTCFLGAELDRPADHAGRPFKGRLAFGGRVESAIFQDMRNSALTSHFGRRESGLVLLGFVREGVVNVRYGDDRREIFDRSSSLVLFDCDRRLTAYSSDISMCCLSLPREAVMSALGRDRSTSLAPVMRLPETGLAAIWRALMEELSRSGAGLNHAGSVAAVQAASALAFTVLSGKATQAKGSLADDALYEAACRAIRLTADDPKLGAGRLAAQLGCSRSRLYRIFAERGKPIVAHVRDVRLERARELLAGEGKVPVALVALQCGYGDPSSFGKAFRRRYDISPSGFQEEASKLRGKPRA